MELVAGVHPVLGWVLGIAAALVVLGGAWKAVIRPGIDMARQISRFLDDWYGRTDLDGVTQPGIRARLDNMETKVEEVHTQTQVNGGGSMKDAVNRIERQAYAIDHKLDMHLLDTIRRDERIAAIEARHHPPYEEPEHKE